MDEPRRGYSMPYCVNQKQQLAVLIGIPLIVAYFYWDASREGMLHGEFGWLLWLVFGGGILYALWEGQQMLWKVHFVPEGIAITLGSWTIRRIPVEELRLLCGVLQKKRNKHGTTIVYWIAVSTRSMEEIAKQRDDAFGCYADQIRHDTARFMNRRVNMRLGVDRRLLWLEYDRERLEALRGLYPAAQWLDCSEGKIFDAPASIFGSKM